MLLKQIKNVIWCVNETKFLFNRRPPVCSPSALQALSKFSIVKIYVQCLYCGILRYTIRMQLKEYVVTLA